MKGKVLVVDDDPNIGRYVKAKLIGAGYEVNCYTSALEALEHIKRLEPIVIIADVRMPEMDGYEFHQMIRNDPETRDIPFIFLSARNRQTDELEGLQLGADDYVGKPFIAETLIERVERAILYSKRRRSYSSRADFGGNLAQLGLVDAIQLIESNRKTGEIEVFTLEASRRGSILFKDGELFNAFMGKLDGTEAFYGLMEFREGYMEFYSRKVDGNKKIMINNTAAILNGSRLTDELRAYLGSLPDQDVTLRVNTDNIPDDVKRKTGQMLLGKILSLIVSGQTVREIINCGFISRCRAGSVLMSLSRSNIIDVADNCLNTA